MKREKYLTWNQYFMELAEVSSMRSKDPSTAVGCCIIDPENNHVISLGYNGFPNGCSDDEFPWDKSSANYSKQKYAYVVHAELNAILNSERSSLKNCTLYVTHSPCNECMKAIVQSGIKKIVYKKEFNPGSESWIASNNMIKAAGIEFEKYNEDI